MSLRKEDIANVYPLSPLQEGMLYETLVHPESRAYFEQVSVELQGNVSAHQFARAWQMVCNRHEILRTIFAARQGKRPHQVVLKQHTAEVSQQDLCSLTDDQRQQMLRECAQQDLERGFELSRTPAHRMALFQTAEDRAILIWSFHHILLDGWSQGILLEDLLDCHAALESPVAAPLQPPVPFVEYIRWLEHQNRDQSIQFWRDTLNGLQRPTRIAGGWKFEQAEDSCIELLSTCPPETQSRLQRALADWSMTASTFMQVVWSLSLARRTGQRDLLFLATVSGRSPEIPNVERIVGLCINAIPVRLQCNDQDTPLNLLERLSEFSARSAAHHQVPLAELLSGIGTNVNPTDHILVYENFPEGEKRPEATLHMGNSSSIGHERTHYPFELQFFQDDNALHVRMRASDQSLGQRQLELFTAQFHSTLEWVLDNPQTPVREFLHSTTAAIGLSASFTLDPLIPATRWWLQQFDQRIDIHQGNYNQVIQDLISPASVLNAPQTSIAFILLRLCDWVPGEAWADPETAAKRLEQSCRQLCELLQSPRNAPLVIISCATPDHILLPDPVASAIESCSQQIAETLHNHPRLHHISESFILARTNICSPHDQLSDQAGHQPFEEPMIAALGAQIARTTLSHMRPGFKVVALDCDQTLWSGVCGEDGPLGVQVSEAHRQFQKHLQACTRKGLILVLASKNNPDDVRAVFEQHPDMVLQLEDIAAQAINWEPKSRNLRMLAQQLNLGLDSFIFLDDSPVECLEVMQNTPEVLSMRLPESPDDYPAFLEHIWALDRLEITAEDQQRTRQYQAEQQRQQLAQASTDMQQFLRELDLEICMRPLTTEDVPRASQLTLRTNQFNTSIRRRQPADIHRLLEQPDISTRIIHARDRFGNYGIVGLIIARKAQDIWTIESFLLSCRALGRGVEDAIISLLAQEAQEHGFQELRLEFRQGDRNQPAHDFLQRTGWQCIHDQEQLRTYHIQISQVPPVAPHVNLAAPESFIEAPPAAPGNSAAPAINKIPHHQDTCSPAPDWHFSLINAGNLRHRADLIPIWTQSGAHMATDLIDPVLSAPRTHQREQTISPQTPTQKVLATIWAELLGHPPAQLDEHFFAMGGHSLLALRLGSKIWKQLRIELSVADILQFPQFDQLAEHIDHLASAPPKSADNQPPEQRAVTAHTAAHSRNLPQSENTETLNASPQCFPLSHGQRRLLLLQEMVDSPRLYVISGFFSGRGAVDGPALFRALNQLCQRHEALRTTFHWNADGQLFQQIHDQLPPDCESVDIPQDTRNPQHWAQSHQERINDQGFCLERGPLVRIQLYHHTSGRWWLGLSIHHLVFDGWSFRILQREWLHLYRQAQGEPLPALSTEPAAYHQYVQWHLDRMHSDEMARQRTFWHQFLQDAPPPLELPTDMPRPAIRRPECGIARFELDSTVCSAIISRSAAHGVTPFAWLCTLVMILLARYAGTNRMTLGTTVHGRPTHRFEDMIGFCVNTLALPLAADMQQGFSQLLTSVSHRCNLAFSHQDYPFDTLVEELELSRDPSRTPLFDVMITQYTELDEDSPEQHSIDLHPVVAESGTNPFDLTFDFYISGEQIVANLHWARDLFEAASIERMVANFSTLASAVLADESQPLERLPVIAPAEAALLNQFANPPTIPCPDQDIFSRFRDLAREHPEQPALHFDGNCWSYAELLDQAQSVATALIQHIGPQPEQVVAVKLERGPELIAALLGTIAAGAIYLPLDPEWPLERCENLLEQSNAQLLLTDPLCRHAQSTAAQLLVNDALQTAARPELLPKIEPEQIAYLIFTSGSTGQPKGVLVPHVAFMNMIVQQIPGFGVIPGTRLLCFAPVSFDAFMSEAFMALLGSATLMLVSTQERYDPMLLQQMMDHSRIDVAIIPPALMPYLDTAVLARRRVIITAGEAPRLSDVERVVEHTQYINAYGPTECAVCASLYQVSAGELARIKRRKSTPMGAPLHNLSAYILDACMQPVPIGVFGDLYLGGIGLARGYLDPAATQRAFIHDPQRGRLYKTGDRVRWRDDGVLEFGGRQDDQFKIRGYRVDPQEVETSASRFPGVRQSALCNSPHGLVLYCRVLPEFTENALYEYLGTQLPRHMLPQYIQVLEQFPLTSSGKIDRRALSGREPDTAASTENLDQGNSHLQQRLCALWAEALNITADRVDPSCDYFRSGGQSLGAIQLARRIATELDCSLPQGVMSLFLYPSPAQLAQVLSDHSSATHQHLAPTASRAGTAPMLYCFASLHWLDFQLFGPMQDELCDWNLISMQPDSLDQGLPQRLALQIRQSLPEYTTPLVLLGYSSGGYLAHAVAAELEQLDIQVDHILLIDSWRQHRPAHSSPAARRAEFPESLRIDPEAREQLANQFRQADEFLARREPIPQVRSPITLIRADHRQSPCPPAWVSQDWSPCTQSTFTVVQGESDHDSMLKSPARQHNLQLIREVIHAHTHP